MSRYDFDRIIERRGTDSVKWNTYPDGVIPMWVADSDFSAPEPVLKALRNRLKHPAFGYSNLDSMLDEASRHWVKNRFGWNAPKGSSAFAPGVVASISLVVNTFTRPGENVVTLSPSYPPLINIPRQNGRKSLASPMLQDAEGKYQIDFEDLENKLLQRETSLFLLCNPHNPTGRVFSREELRRIGNLCLENDVLVLADEIHCDYVHVGKHVSFPTLSPEFAGNSLVSLNPSKTFNIAGLHTAVVMTENQEHLGRYKKAAMAAGLHSNILGATAFRAAYLECADYADQVEEYIKANLEFAVDYIQRELPAFSAIMPEATYLLWLDCRGMGLHQDELIRFFLEEANVAPGSGTDYNSLHGHEGEGFVRLNLACPRATVEEALRRITRKI